MTRQKETHLPSGGAAICIGFGAVFMLLTGLLIWQPRASIWIAEAVDAEFSGAADARMPVRLADKPKRRPIDPREWGQTFDQRPLVRELAQQKESPTRHETARVTLDDEDFRRLAGFIKPSSDANRRGPTRKSGHQRQRRAQAIADISRRACPKAQIDIVAPDTPNLAWSAVMTASGTKLSVGRQ